MMDKIEKTRSILNRPERWDFSGAQSLYAGVDLGTYKAIVIVIDENGDPRAATMRKAEVVRSGLILDYFGALQIVREMMEEIRERSPLPIEKGATSFPPNTETANVETTSYILQGANLDVLNVLDEPTAANQVLQLNNGAIVDVGGGTTGVAVIKGGEVIFSDDEATGGVHLTLVLAGSLRKSYEEAEVFKMDGQRQRDILPVVRPVIEKISSIVSSCLREYRDVRKVCLVGGTCELEGFSKIVSESLGLETFLPKVPQVITPLGIALSCLEAEEQLLPNAINE